ncbi:hypothetical protein ACFX10_010279 [Malus domestica]
MRNQIRLVIQESGLVEKIQSCGFEVVVGVGNLVSFGDGKRDWKLSRGEVKGVVGSLCGGGESEWVRKGKFYKRWSEFMVAGAVLLEEIFEETFEALRKFDHLTNIQVAASLDAKDLEYLEAACVLHNIGISVGKKGCHKHSCSIITKGNHLHGYSTEEVKLIALLAKHHRKNLPNFDHVSFKEFPEQTCSSVKDQNYPPGIVQTLAEDIGDELRQEFAHFKMAFQEELYIVVPSSASE